MIPERQLIEFRFSSTSKQGSAVSRPFSLREKQLLQHLAAQGRNAEILMAQIEAAQHDGAWFAGSQSFEIATDANVPQYWSGEDIGGGLQLGPGCSVCVNGSLPDDEANHIGEVFLWILDGLLSALEYSWVTEKMPGVAPPRPTRHMMLIPEDKAIDGSTDRVIDVVRDTLAR